MERARWRRPAPPVSTHREVLADEHARWQIARRLPHNDTNTPES
jgi:hypothetical protein